MSPSGGFFPSRPPIVNVDLSGGPLPARELRQSLATTRAAVDQLIANQGALASQIGGASAQLVVESARRHADQLAALLADAERLEAAAPPAPVPPAQLLTSAQAALALGQPIPIVFARRRGGRGGVLHFPPATEGAFEASPSGFSGAYHCVLTKGQMAPWRCGRFARAPAAWATSVSPTTAARGRGSQGIGPFPRRPTNCPTCRLNVEVVVITGAWRRLSFATPTRRVTRAGTGRGMPSLSLGW